MTWLTYDQGLIDEIASRMDLREPNKAALGKIIENIQRDEFKEVVCDLATGVGKTYLAAALVDYLASQGIRNILFVTPGRTIQEKTIQNFSPGSKKYVPGTEYQPLLITAENFSRGQVGDALHESNTVKLFVFNVQQLIRPATNMSRKVRELDEFIGNNLYAHLQTADDLVVIADEHHVYRGQAKAFSSAIRDLNPRALVGLTATPDKADLDKVIYRYSLAEAIADELVKIPVIVYRKDGHTDVATQLADACRLRDIKAAAYAQWSQGTGSSAINPVLFVVCQSIQEAKETAQLLASEAYIGDPTAVLEITSASSDEALRALSEVENPESPIRAVVSVDKLKEGWDVKNIGVIVAVRKLASEALTEQILGRGLRLPFGRRVGVPMIDQVDLVAHDSYRKLLDQKDVLMERIAPTGESASTGEPLMPGAEASELEAAIEKMQEIEAEQGVFELVSPPRVIEGETVDGAVSLMIEEFSITEAKGLRDASEYKILQKVPGAPTIRFPRREQKVLPVKFSLSLVDDLDARATGASFVQEFHIDLHREALNAHRTIDGNVSVQREAQASEIAYQELVSLKDVRDDLETRLLGLGLVEESLAEYQAAKRVVKAFLEGAGANESDEVTWGAERAHQAVIGLGRLVKHKFQMRALQPEYYYQPVRLPVEGRSMPKEVHDRYGEFKRKAWYSGWQKSVLPVASFDAKSTEFRIAGILDASSRIQWWLRLQQQDPVHIRLDNGGKYFPDFIAVDAMGVQWLIEGKSDNDVTRPDVIIKRKAAEDWARAVTDSQEFGTWKYLFCSETTLRKSKDSWDSLIATAAEPV
ncbi:MAG: DEAD/DEAH box helicase family protein [Renibacterium salmoninarum]|nr:DEAD/DEAH box helicase family protein [Renibacterium salmoninarum]